MQQSKPRGLENGGAPIRALIFDMDGTILDTRPYHMESWRQLVEELGLTEREYQLAETGFGKTNKGIFDSWFDNGKKPPQPYEQMANRKEGIFRNLIKGKSEARPGFHELLALAHDRGVRIALSTSAPQENAEFILKELGVTHLFHAVVWSRTDLQSKPAPDFFLEAARQLKVKPEQCVGFEDSVHGLEAVSRAEMRIVAIAEQEGDLERHKRWTDDVYLDFRPVVDKLRQRWAR